MMIELLEQKWRMGELPIMNGIVKSSGEYYVLEDSEGQINVAEPIPFSFNFLSDDFSEIDPLFEMDTDEYKIYCGEGGWGGDGFIYVENRETGKMVWCLFADFLNPIIRCEIANNLLIAENNNDCRYTFEFQNPRG